MAEPLKLEYACTPAEMDEAASLSIREQVGGGSRWRSWLVLVGVVIAVYALLYFMIRQDLPEAYRPYLAPSLVLFFVVILLWVRRARPRSDATVQVEVSIDQLTLIGGESRRILPWSAFSKFIESEALFVLLDRTKATLVVVPKRAFLDQTAVGWFRSLASQRPSPSAGAPAAPADATLAGPPISLKFTLGFADFVDRTLASWFTRGLLLGMAALLLGPGIYGVATFRPQPGQSAGWIYFPIMFAGLLVVGTLVVVIATAQTWFLHRRHLIAQEVGLFPDCVSIASADGTSTLPWSGYSRYKETRRSYLLWNPRGLAWLLLPKRAFTSVTDIERCRALLGQHLRMSTWYFG